MNYNVLKIALVVVFIFVVRCSFAQSNDTTNVVISEIVTDSVKLEDPILSDALLVDEVVAVVGDKMILLSDFHMQSIFWKHRNGINPRARLSQEEQIAVFEQMLTQKLLATRAIADSLVVSEASVMGKVEARINNMILKLGTIEEVEKLLSSSIFQIRAMLGYEILEESYAEMMKRVINEDMIITPLDVKRMSRKLSKDSVALIPRQVAYSHIVKTPSSNTKAKLKIKAEMLELRRRITRGDSFSAIARMHSEDHVTAIRGGEMDYAILGGTYVREFEGAVKTLKVGGISGIIETVHGFHLIQLMDIRNGQYKVRHILRRLKMDADELESAIKELELIRGEIEAGTLTFEEAAAKVSDDEKSKSKGGQLLNQVAVMNLGPKGQSDKFFVDELQYDAENVLSLKVGEVSPVFISYDPVTQVQICKIVKLVAEYPEHRANYDEDYSYFENITMGEKGESVFNLWMCENIKNTYIRIEAPYNQSNFIYNWTKKDK